MPKFYYEGVTASNTKVKGEILARDRNEAVNALNNKRIRANILRRTSTEFSFNIRRTVKVVDISRFTRQFAAMISAGLPLIQCIDVLSEQTENRSLANALRQVSNNVQSGSSLSEAFGKHPKVFNKFYCNMIEAGEKAGNLDGVLKRLADHLEKAHSLIRKVKGAMTYPLIVLIVSVGATALLLTFVVPKFAEMFIDFGGELPVPTLVVMAISEFFKKYFLLIIGFICVIILLLNRYRKTEKGAYIFDSILLKIPIVGDLQRKSSISRFSQTLATLLNSGINILNALSITAKTAGNKVLEKGILNTIDRISSGQSIAEPLSETGLLPPMVIHMISVGEKTGDMSSMLFKISDFYEEEVDTAVDALTSVLEPIMIVFLGLLIGGILIAMYLPLFNVMNLVG